MMFEPAAIVSTILDLVVVVLGFSLIIVVHELGHFVAARWAGIRVLAFAVGFGPALVSFRKGLGWRRGSSEGEFRGLASEPGSGASVERGGGVSTTEYRLNMLPLGGYVKMLGQDDADPSARSDDPDSYQRAPVWKRMIVISAGVVANVILAVALFIVVFSIGLKTEAPVIGEVAPGKPAAVAVATDAAALGISSAGLKPGDRVLRVDGETPDSFNDLQLATAMARRGGKVELEVQREGFARAIHFAISPVVDEQSRMLTIGVAPMPSGTIVSSTSTQGREAIADMLESAGLKELKPGDRLTSVNGQPASSAVDIERAVNAGAGAAVRAGFVRDDGTSVSVTIAGRSVLQDAEIRISERSKASFTHLLGLTPAMGVQKVVAGTSAEKAGLRAGDVFVQIGAVEWPALPAGLSEIQGAKGKTVRIVVGRMENGALVEKDLGQVPVSAQGTVGFVYGGAGENGRFVTRWPRGVDDLSAGPSGAGLGLAGGTRIDTLDGEPVASLRDLRERLRGKISAAGPGRSVSVTLGVSRPLGGAGDGRAEVAWAIPAEESAAIMALGYAGPLSPVFFEPMTTVIKGDGVAGSVAKGLKETRRIMIMTYVTFARLFEGTLKIEHLKGPVGIAHVGVLIADRGAVWLLFFMALISVNLAVVNFLPLPIVDGGHMVFLLYEQFTGKPPPVGVQNGAAIAGLVLIATVFLIVTFHDVSGVIRSVFGG